MKLSATWIADIDTTRIVSFLPAKLQVSNRVPFIEAVRQFGIFSISSFTAVILKYKFYTMHPQKK